MALYEHAVRFKRDIVEWEFTSNDCDMLCRSILNAKVDADNAWIIALLVLSLIGNIIFVAIVVKIPLFRGVAIQIFHNIWMNCRAFVLRSPIVEVDVQMVRVAERADTNVSSRNFVAEVESVASLACIPTTRSLADQVVIEMGDHELPVSSQVCAQITSESPTSFGTEDPYGI